MIKVWFNNAFVYFNYSAHGDKWPDSFECTNTRSDFFNFLYVLLPGKVFLYVKSKRLTMLSLIYFDTSYIYLNCIVIKRLQKKEAGRNNEVSVLMGGR